MNHQHAVDVTLVVLMFWLTALTVYVLRRPR